MWALTKSTGVSSQEYSHALVMVCHYISDYSENSDYSEYSENFCFSVNEPACQGREFLYAAVA